MSIYYNFFKPTISPGGYWSRFIDFFIFSIADSRESAITMDSGTRLNNVSWSIDLIDFSAFIKFGTYLFIYSRCIKNGTQNPVNLIDNDLISI